VEAAPSLEAERVASLRRHGILDASSDRDLDRIVGLARVMLGVKMAAISLVDRDRQCFLSRQGLHSSETSRDVSFCTHTIQTEAPMVVTDAALDPRFLENPMVTGDPRIRFYAGVPLVSSDGHALGALCALDPSPKPISTEQLAGLQELAGLAMDQIELRRQAALDPLTGVLNRGTFDRLAAAEVAEAHALGTSLVALMVDADHFKAINDTYGHSVGDMALRRLAETLELAVRRTDYVARYGGEEFCVLLPSAGPRDAIQIAERIRAMLTEMTVPTVNGPLILTVSIGIGVLAPTDGTVETMLLAADNALYAAKQEGRNRVAVAPFE
jgi:diguanylate cyclase (GGDEF)-like protein